MWDYVIFEERNNTIYFLQIKLNYFNTYMGFATTALLGPVCPVAYGGYC